MALLLRQGFEEGVTFAAKDKCTILHLAAWGGHTKILEMLQCSIETARHLPFLLAAKNRFGEMPESTAFRQYVAETLQFDKREFGVLESLHVERDARAQQFATFAESCARARVGDPAVTVQTFVKQANATCQSHDSLSPKIEIDPGTEPEVLFGHLRSLASIR